MDYDRIFAQLEELQERASVEAVYGEPVETEGKIVIPVASVSYAFGLGFEEGEGPRIENRARSSGSSGGGGGGVQAKPVALIEITPERTYIEGVVDEQAITLAGIAFAAWAVFWVASALIRIFGRKT